MRYLLLIFLVLVALNIGMAVHLLSYNGFAVIYLVYAVVQLNFILFDLCYGNF